MHTGLPHPKYNTKNIALPLKIKELCKIDRPLYAGELFDYHNIMASEVNSIKQTIPLFPVYLLLLKKYTSTKMPRTDEYLQVNYPLGEMSVGVTIFGEGVGGLEPIPWDAFLLQKHRKPGNPASTYPRKGSRITRIYMELTLQFFLSFPILLQLGKIFIQNKHFGQAQSSHSGTKVIYQWKRIVRTCGKTLVCKRYQYTNTSKCTDASTTGWHFRSLNRRRIRFYQRFSKNHREFCKNFRTI